MGTKMPITGHSASEVYNKDRITEVKVTQSKLTDF
jgi:hypothetical protein